MDKVLNTFNLPEQLSHGSTCNEAPGAQFLF